METNLEFKGKSCEENRICWTMNRTKFKKENSPNVHSLSMFDLRLF